MSDVFFLLMVFLLAFAAAYSLISRVPALLHTPLMSMTNAISAVVILGGILLFSDVRSPHEILLGLAAIAAASFNIVGGFFITGRMLAMFKKSTTPPVS
jgi:H+-translocating NAD(P) transhydrogenase subunit alpha